MSELKKTITDRAVEYVLSALIQIAILAGALWVNSKISEYRLDSLEINLKEQASIVKELAGQIRGQDVRLQVQTEKLDNVIRRIDILENRLERIEAQHLSGKP